MNAMSGLKPHSSATTCAGGDAEQWRQGCACRPSLPCCPKRCVSADARMMLETRFGAEHEEGLPGQ